MAIVRRIVEQHGATIEIESAPGAGTKVRVCFAPSGSDIIPH